MKLNLRDKLIIRRQKEVNRICQQNTKSHPILVEKLMEVQKRYDKLINGGRAKEKDEICKYFGLLG